MPQVRLVDKFLKLLIFVALVASMGATNNFEVARAASIPVSDTSSVPESGARLQWPPSDIRILHTSGDSPPAVDVRLVSSQGGEVHVRVLENIVAGVQYVYVPTLADDSYTLSYMHRNMPVTSSFSVKSQGMYMEGISTEKSVNSMTGKSSMLFVSTAFTALFLFAAFYVVRFKKLTKIRKIVYPVSFVLLLGGASSILSLAIPDLASQDATNCIILVSLARNECLAESGLDVVKNEGLSAAIVFLKDLDADPRFTSRNGERICHEVAHTLGQKVLRMDRNVLGSLTGDYAVCDLGFVHGVAEAAGRHLPTDDFYSDLAGFCSAINNVKDCPHGVGHSIAIRNNVSMPESVAMCDKYFAKSAADECIGAVAMSAGEWLGNQLIRTRSYALSLPHNSPSKDMLLWCSSLAGRPESNKKCMAGLALVYKSAKEGLDFLPQGYRTPRELAASCLRLDVYVDNCLLAVGVAAVAYAPDLPGSYAPLCDSLGSATGISSCYVGVAGQVRVGVADLTDQGNFMQMVCASSANFAVCSKSPSVL